MANRLQAADVKSSIAPVDFYRMEIDTMPEPKRDTGWVDGGLCCFHSDRHRGNFRVNLDTGAFVCFACGSRGADIIAFTQMRRGLSFIDALHELVACWEVFV